MIEVDVLYRICPMASRARLARCLGPLNAAMEEFEVNTPRRQAMFIPQVAQETGQFFYTAEIADGHKYDQRADLGNTRPEAIEIATRHGTTAGRFWKGHGWIQVTGYDNHCAAAAALGLDCVEQPQLLEEPINAARSAGWFWRAHGLNEIADAGTEDAFRQVTRKINGACSDGPPTHYLQRFAYWQAAKPALGA